MDIESNPIESQSEPMETAESLSVNGCDDDNNEKPQQKVNETVATTDQLDDIDTNPSIPPESDRKHIDESENSPINSPIKSPQTNQPIILSTSETESYEVIDSDNQSETNSPQKNVSAILSTKEIDVAEAVPIETSAEKEEEVAEVETTEADTTIEMECPPPAEEIEDDHIIETDNDTNKKSDECSPEKSQSNSDVSCLILSPSDQVDESKDWNDGDQTDIANLDKDDDSIDDDVDGDDSDNLDIALVQAADDAAAAMDEDNACSEEISMIEKRSNSKTEQKSNNDCEIFELTDDNSSGDEAHESEGEADIDEEEDEEDEEDDDDEDEDDARQSGKK